MKYISTNHIKIRALDDKEVNSFYYSCLNVDMNINYNGGMHHQLKDIINLMEEMTPKGKVEAKMLLYHMTLAFKNNCKGFVVCLNSEVYKRNRGEVWSSSYRKTINLLESLVYHGYGTLYRGDSEREGIVKFKSVFVLSDKLKDMLSSKRVSLFPKKVDKVTTPSVVIKGECNRGIRKIKTNVDNISEFLTGFDFNFNGTSIFPILTRIFGGTFEDYGRFYFLAQTIKSIYRKEFTIDGEVVTEIDYGSNHARICAELAGVPLSENFKPYNIGNINLVTSVPSGRDSREVFKMGMMCLLNCKGGHHKALSNSWDEKLKGFGGKENCGAIIRGLKENNKMYLDEIYKQTASSLQFIDSCILEYIMLSLVDLGIPFLPYHDSIIVPLSKRDITKNLMVEGWRHVLGSDTCCVVDVKY